MLNDDSGLEAERYRVTDVQQIDEVAETHGMYKNGNAVTETSQVLNSKDIDALPGKNITGNAGNGRVAFLITKDQRQRLCDLGYTRAEVEGMKPADAQEILAAEGHYLDQDVVTI
jgi:hypothetical protein